VSSVPEPTVPASPLGPAARARSSGLEFAEAWGVLARTLAFYPETNDRVRLAVEQALAAFEGARRDGGGEVCVLLSRKEVLVGRTVTALQPGSNLVWLAERLERSGLAGATFESTLEAQGLVDFSLQLLKGYRRTLLDPEFECAAREVPSGITPIEQRFEGSFRSAGEDERGSWLEALVAAHPGARTDPLALVAARDQRVRERIDGLLNSLSLEPSTKGPSVKAAELLTQLVHALPAEATHREEDLIKLTVELLDAVRVEIGRDQHTAAGGAYGELFEGSQVAQALAEVCRRAFAREGRPSEELVQRRMEGAPPEPIAPWMRGHPQDEHIADDVEALVGEVAALPSTEQADLSLEQALEPTEQLGVYLHYMTTLDSDEEAARTHALAATCIRAASPDAREVLALYLEPLRRQGGAAQDERQRRRMLRLLRENDLTHLLTELEVFSDATVVDVFPRYFGPWLDALDLSRQESRARLVEVCTALGPQRIRAAAAALAGPEGILTAWRSSQILAVCEPALGPLARILLNHGDAQTKVAVVRFLRRFAAGREEACLLDLLEVGELPRDYLAELLDPSPDPQVYERMRGRIADILAERVEHWEGTPRFARRRLDAVGLLAVFHSRHAEQVLRQLARRTRLFRSEVENDLQRAARESLRTYP